MKLGVNDVVQSYYQSKAEEAFGLEDLKSLEDKNPQVSKNTLDIAKMQILSDILCGKKPKKSSQQLFLFLPPLIKLLEKENTEISEAANEIRREADLINIVIRMTANALYEIAKVISGYEERFHEMKKLYEVSLSPDTYPTWHQRRFAQDRNPHLQ